MKALMGMALAAGLAMAGAADAATITYDFGSATGNLGTSHTYVSSGLSIIATGYDQTGATTDFFAKNNGGDEVGIGLANDPTGENEIHLDSGFVQLDVSGLFGRADPSATYFSTNSTTGGEEWAVFGSNTAGVHGSSPLLTGTSETSHLLPGLGSYKYYDFVESNFTAGQGNNFLIHQLTTAGVPEPASWAMMLIGFGGLGATLRSRRRHAGATAQAC